MSKAHSIKAVIFDMDGTITVPLLDFPLIRAEIGLQGDRGLLESLSDMSGERRGRAEAILLTHELTAARESTLNEGVVETLRELEETAVKTAILTRNCRASAEIVLSKHKLRFDAVVTREDCLPKPDPDGVKIAAERMGVDTQACVLVGDYEYDIRAGRAAGALTVLFAQDGRRFSAEPDFEISSMSQLMNIIRDLNGGLSDQGEEDGIRVS